MAIVSYTRRPMALFGLSAVWLLLLCGPALAHAELAKEYPAAGGTLNEAPQQVQLLFSEPVEPEFEPVEVFDEQGNRLSQNNAHVSPNSAKLVVVDLQEELPDGSYTVEWRVSSVDGHPINGGYGFSIDTSAADTDGDGGSPIETVESSAEQEESGLGQDLILVLALGVLLVGILAVVGLVALRRRKGAV